MKLTKKMEKMIDDRCHYQEKALVLASQIQDFLDMHGIEIDPAFCITGVGSIMEPQVTAGVIRQAILEAKE